MCTIPLIDFSERTEAGTIAELRNAMESVGFFILENCDPLFSKDRIRNCLTLCERLFSLSSKESKEGARTGNDRLRGYFSVGDENVEGLLSNEDVPTGRNLGKIDFKEGWEFGPPDHQVASKRFPAMSKIFGGTDNVYPHELVGLKTEISEIYTDLLEVATEIVLMIEKALGLEPESITKHCEDPCSTLRFLHYWPLPTERKDSVSIGAHRDYGLLTLLMVDECGGLEVLAPDGVSWIRAPIPETGFVVNIGDILMQWTDGRLKSNVHRVIHTATERHRYSIPFFYEPDLDTQITPGGVLSSSPTLEDGESAGEILVRYYAKSGLLREGLIRTILG